MADILREHAASGVPVLFSSHQLDLVERLCDHLIVLARGPGRRAGRRRRRCAPAVRPAYRLVTDGDAGWVRDVRGIHVHDVDGSAALLELADRPAPSRPCCARRCDRGAVREFTRVVPPLAEIYREVTA